LIEEQTWRPIQRRLTNLSELASQKDDSNLPRFSKRHSIITKPNFSFSSGASGLLASFNSSAFKNTLKIESTKDPQNMSMGNILEELDEKEEKPKENQGKRSHMKRHSLCVTSKGQIKEESTKNDSLCIYLNENKNNLKQKNEIKIETQNELSALSEKSKSGQYNAMKLKEESVQSNNQIQNESKSINSEKQSNCIIKPKVIRIKAIKEKRKTNKVFQSMEDKFQNKNVFLQKQKMRNNPK